MDRPWPADLPGVLTLPSGRRVLGRGLRSDPPSPAPEFGVYLLGRRPAGTPWEQLWVRWRDFGLPAGPDALRTAMTTAWERAASERVEVACGGGTGRTGQRWPAWPSWTACRRTRRWRSSAPATGRGRWRPGGSAGSC